jgi:hypothetical protein
MPKASKQTASDAMTVPGYEGHFEELEGYTVGFETYSEDSDMAPMFVGLPDDRCQCPHLGYVLKGKVKFTYADGSEELTKRVRPTMLRRVTHRRSTPEPRWSSSPQRGTATDRRSGDPKHGGRLGLTKTFPPRGTKGVAPAESDVHTGVHGLPKVG